MKGAPDLPVGSICFGNVSSVSIGEMQSILSSASVSDTTAMPKPLMCNIRIDTLRQIRILLRCIQQPVVAYDADVLTMVQSAVGYCAEQAAQIEALLPKHGMLGDDE